MAEQPMVERVARVIEASIPWEMSGGHKERASRIALAAIEAMDLPAIIKEAEQRAYERGYETAEAVADVDRDRY